MRIVIDQARAFERHTELAAELLEAIGTRLFDDGADLDLARVTWSYGWMAQAHIDCLEEMVAFRIGTPRLRPEDLLDGFHVSLCAAEGGRRIWASIHDADGPVPRDRLPPHGVQDPSIRALCRGPRRSPPSGPRRRRAVARRTAAPDVKIPS
jgi:hypothetical protein